MKVKKLLSFEWDAIAGILAAILGIILHLLHVVDEHIILPIVLALMALLFINFMRHTRNNELTAEEVERTGRLVRSIHSALTQPDVVLVGPRQLRTVNEQFARNMCGDVICFNVCLSMYKTQPLFDALLRPAIENTMVRSIHFVLDEGQRELWAEVHAKIADCAGHERVSEPHWCKLSKSLSFILADSRQSGGAEALLSFWGEPFMSQSTGSGMPRYIFHIQKGSELLTHLVDLQHRDMHHH